MESTSTAYLGNRNDKKALILGDGDISAAIAVYMLDAATEQKLSSVNWLQDT